MEKLGLNTLRTMFLEFFESKAHHRLQSAPLVPQGDNSLLLINSGMAPLKPYFTGEITPPAPRAVSCQKCIRTPDIENVGKNARHGTYFEMLGNFSFGDYFKRDAQKWAWEFITEHLKLPLDKVYVTVYLDDDESYDIWANEVGVDTAHISRLGKADNFWEIGIGPCGPSSEIYYDRGEKYGCGSPDCAPGCDCDRFVEFWNLVFTQYDSDGQGNYTPLAKKNIDTGMGLERIACIVQGVDTLFDVDTMRAITAHVSRLTGVTYNQSAERDVSLRIITDHIRSTTMMICDGVMPANVGRGYVLRRLLRRAARHGRLLGVTEPFLYEVCDTVIEANAGAYPELRDKEAFIKTVIKTEEERFGNTIEAGLVRLDEHMSELKGVGKDILSGEDAFRLYDTHGFPIDLTVEILDEQGLKVDRSGFDALMGKQKAQAKAAHLGKGDLGWDSDEVSLKDLPATVFEGYAEERCKGKVLAIISGGMVPVAGEGDGVTVITDRTPFYAESGGQAGDRGVIESDTAMLTVVDTRKSPDGKFLHICEVQSGELHVGDAVTLAVDSRRRLAIRRAHSATHLLHKALRDTLGVHVEQSGSLVEPDHLRFDFSHFAATSAEELETIECSVNEAILGGLAIEVREMSQADAKKMGAMALFGEKYGDTVRVVTMGRHSVELCGGTHLENTAQVGLFKITSEASVAAGVRRIEACCGLASLDLVRSLERESAFLADALKTIPHNLRQRAAQVMEELRILGRDKEALEGKLSALRAGELMLHCQTVAGVRLIAVMVEGQSADTLRGLSDSLRDKAADLVCILASVTADGKVALAAACGKEAVAKGAHAGKLIKEVATLCGGGGGGKPDSATAGGRDPSKLQDALTAVAALVEAQIK